MLSVRQHVHKCVAAIPPLPPVVTLPWQLEALLPNEKRRRVESMSLAQNTVGQLLEESREEREKKRYVCVYLCLFVWCPVCVCVCVCVRESVRERERERESVCVYTSMCLCMCSIVLPNIGQYKNNTCAACSSIGGSSCCLWISHLCSKSHYCCPAYGTPLPLHLSLILPNRSSGNWPLSFIVKANSVHVTLESWSGSTTNSSFSQGVETMTLHTRPYLPQRLNYKHSRFHPPRFSLKLGLVVFLYL